MTTERPQPEEKVEAGQIWFHQGRPSEPYTVLDVLPNATGYESTGQLGKQIVIYEQGYDGQVAKKGTRWARELPDFLGTTEVNNKPVRNFVQKIEN